MLPSKVSNLADGFVRVFDLEHSITIELRKAHNRAAVSLQQSGVGYSIDGLILYIGKNLTVFLEERAQFIWEKLKQVVTSTEIEHYPKLNADLKSKIASYYNPARQAAESYLEQMRQSANVPTGYTVESKRGFDNILSKINAEVDLFCEEYAVKEKWGNRNRTATKRNDEFHREEEEAPATPTEGLLRLIWKSPFRWPVIVIAVVIGAAFAVFAVLPEEIKLEILKYLGLR